MIPLRVFGDGSASLTARFARYSPDDPEWSFLAPSIATVELGGWRTPDAASLPAAELAALGAGPLAQLRAAVADAGIGRIAVELAASDAAGREAFAELGLRESVVFAARDVAPPACAAASVTVRPASFADRDELVRLAHEEAMHQALNTSAGTSPEQPIALFERLVDEWLGDPLTAVFIADAAGRTVGMVVVEAHPASLLVRALGIADDYGYISVACVTRAARGAGAGGALVARAMEWCHGQGLERVALHYIADNAASAPFWKRHGFEAIAVTLAENTKWDRGTI